MWAVAARRKLPMPQPRAARGPLDPDWESVVHVIDVPQGDAPDRDSLPYTLRFFYQVAQGVGWQRAWGGRGCRVAEGMGWGGPGLGGVGCLALCYTNINTPPVS